MIGLLLFLIGKPSFVFLDTIYVPTDSATPQKAWNGITDSTLVILENGTYNITTPLVYGAGPGTSANMIGMQGTGAESVIIDANGSCAGFCFQPVETQTRENLLLQDFTMREGKYGYGAGFLASHTPTGPFIGSIVLRRIKWVNDSATAMGVIYITPWNGADCDSIWIENSLFDGCGYPGKVLLDLRQDYGSSPSGKLYFINNTIINCISIYMLNIYQLRGYVFNTIIWNNTTSGLQLCYLDGVYNSDWDTSSYNEVPIRVDNIEEDPLFINAGSNYRLQTGSPCKDVGYDVSAIITENKDLDGYTWTGTYEMGCYSYLEYLKVKLSTLEFYMH